MNSEFKINEDAGRRTGISYPSGASAAYIYNSMDGIGCQRGAKQETPGTLTINREIITHTPARTG